jgi:hypothetical protein
LLTNLDRIQQPAVKIGTIPANQISKIMTFIPASFLLLRVITNKLAIPRWIVHIMDDAINYCGQMLCLALEREPRDNPGT